MNAIAISAGLLVTFGMVILASSGIGFTPVPEPVRFFDVQAATRETPSIPPVVGALSLAGGSVLLLLKPRSY